MHLDGLRHFVDLARTLHFGNSSRNCRLSQSALTRSIQRLEQELGVSLLRRDNRNVSLTAEGARVQRYAREVLAGFEQLQAELRAGKDRVTGALSLFCSVTAAHSFLPTLLSRFRQAYPEVTIVLQTGYAVDALARLQDDTVDATVAALPESVPASLLSRAITRTPLLFVAPRAECEVRRMVEHPPIDWSEVPMILPESGLARAGIDRWFRARSLAPRVYGEVSGNEAALSLIALGCGVGIVPGLVLEKSPLHGEVQALEVRPRLPDFRVGVCVKRKQLANPVVKAFWQSISEARFGTSSE
jgi:LysR family positive regulator for ilvC